MRFVLPLIIVLAVAPWARADDAADVKQAYLTYLQARLDRNLDAAKAASVGDEMAQKFLALDVERQVLTGKISEARAKLKGTTQPSTPKQTAAEIFTTMLNMADITVDGDSATIKPKNSPRGYGFQKVNGQWKADLNKWENPVKPEQAAMLEKFMPFMRDIAAKLDSGEIKTAEDLEAAMQNAERQARAAAGMGPSTKPSH